MIPAASSSIAQRKSRVPAWFGRAAAAVALVVIAVAAALVWGRLVSTVQNAKPVPAANRPRVNAIVWGGRAFTSKEPLSRWLNARGGSYAAWAKIHPAGWALLARNRRG